MEFGDRLRALRLGLGISQKQLEIDSNLPETWVSQVEHGRREPSIKNLVKLAKSLELSKKDVFYLIGLKD